MPTKCIQSVLYLESPWRGPTAPQMRLFVSWMVSEVCALKLHCLTRHLRLSEATWLSSHEMPVAELFLIEIFYKSRGRSPCQRVWKRSCVSLLPDVHSWQLGGMEIPCFILLSQLHKVGTVLNLSASVQWKSCRIKWWYVLNTVLTDLNA